MAEAGGGGNANGTSGGSGAQYLAAGAEIGGGLLTSAFSVHESRQNRRFAREMANTAHQREVADLKAAGLNPILSATGGSGAATPSTSPANPENPMKGFTSNSMTAVQARSMRAQLENLTEDTTEKRLNNMIKQSLYDDELYARRAGYLQRIKQGDLQGAELENMKAALRKTNAEIELKGLEAQHSSLGLNEAKADSSYYGGFVGKNERYLNEGSRILGNVLGGLQGAKGRASRGRAGHDPNEYDVHSAKDVYDKRGNLSSRVETKTSRRQRPLPDWN